MGGHALTSILLDTQVIVWLAEASPRLGSRSKTMIDTALRAGGILVSAFSFWEIAMALSRGRLISADDADTWRREALKSGIEEIPVTGEIGILSVRLSGLHQDPADRIIAATAIREQACLVTSDRHLLAWKNPLDRHDARK